MGVGSSTDVGVGTVADFDEHRGTGTVAARDGSRLSFHCTCITGGSRAIAVGAPVAFRVVPGRRGRWEATDLEALDAEP